MADYLNNFSTNLSSYFTPLKPAAGKQKKDLRPEQTVRDTDQPTQAGFHEEWLSSTKTVDFADLDQSTPTIGAAHKKPNHLPKAQKKIRRKKTADDYVPSSESSDEDLEEPTKKKRKREHDFDMLVVDDDADSDYDLEGSTLITSPDQMQKARQAYRAVLDRKRMPPPPTPERSDVVSYTPDPKLVDKSLNRMHKIVRKEVEDPELSDEELLSERNQVKKTDRREVAYDFDLERARRYATAAELPKDSGYWSEAEKEIFFRLVMRGFEPLVPGNWKLDFKTLPESLFSVEGGEDPVIDPYSLSHFRASYFLSTLLALGMRVRDRRVMHLRSEPIVKSTLRQFISWALHDAGVHPSQRPNAIPIHTISARRLGEKSHQAIDRMTRKLRRLASSYQDLYRTYPSVESNHDNSPAASDEDDVRFPVLTGLLICSSVVLIVTLPSDPFHFRSVAPLPPSTNDTDPPTLKDETSRIRFIATFDFSDFGMDVWNGLAIAIVVMIIRKTMRKMLTAQEESGDQVMWKSADDTEETLIGGTAEDKDMDA